jgi:hypothetical protein
VLGARQQSALAKGDRPAANLPRPTSLRLLNGRLAAMSTRICDSCKESIEPSDMEALSIGRRTKRYRIHLCGKCSAGLIEMLKDMRLIKTKTPKPAPSPPPPTLQ